MSLSLYIQDYIMLAGPITYNMIGSLSVSFKIHFLKK